MAISDIDPNNFNTVGEVGVALYGLFLVLAAWRTVVSLMDEPLNRNFALRPAFHVAMLAFSVLEFIYMIGLAAEGGYSKWNYTCHTFAQFFNLAAFSTVILLWGKTINLGGSAVWVNRFVLLVNAVNLALAFAVAISVLAARNMDDFLDNNPAAYLMSIFVHSLSLFAFSAWMLSYGLRLQWKLTTYPQWEPMEVRRRLEILLKINFVLVLCVLCYTLRVIALGFLLVDILTGSGSTDAYSMLAWFALSTFVPTIVPGVVLLYVMRTRRGQASVRLTQAGGAPLMQTGAGGSPTAPLTAELSPSDAVHGPGAYEPPEDRDDDSDRQRQHSYDPYSRYERFSSVSTPTQFLSP